MKYLGPLEFYSTYVKDIFSSTSPNYGRLLGFDVRSNYMSLAVSDWKNLTAVPLSVLSWTKTQKNQTSMVETILASISKYQVVGLIVGSPHVQCLESPDSVPFSPQTKTFIDTLSETGKSGDLKFTYWDADIASKNAEFVLNQHIEYVLKHLDKDVEVGSKTIVNKCHAVSVLQGYLDDARKKWLAVDDATNKSLAEDEATKISLADDCI